MWKLDVVKKLQDIHEGKTGSELEQRFLRDYIVFYGMTDEVGHNMYGISYNSVMDMLSGKAINNFLWIYYHGPCDRSNECTNIYVKDPITEEE